MKKNIYIIGSKGIPAKYGGFETFVEKLTEYKKNENIQYHIACMEENSLKSGISDEYFDYNGSNCFNIKVPNIGPAKAIIYDILALKKAIEISKKNMDRDPIFYILACRIGPIIFHFKKIIKEMNGKLFVNPDGHEWLRGKWSFPVRRYWKFSERLMIKHSDIIICDSCNIEKYILHDYKKYNPTTHFIAYGTDMKKTLYDESNKIVRKWYEDKNVREGNYYLVVGRFVPENNYVIMIKEYMKSQTEKDFVLITNIEKNSFYEKLQRETDFLSDDRIKFVGTVYDQDLLKYIRENAFAYFHGHEVGGTNPSLLEALFSTQLNLLLDVPFNKEVSMDSALYWDKRPDSLAQLIDYTDHLSNQQISKLKLKASNRIASSYNWDLIINLYEKIFDEG